MQTNASEATFISLLAGRTTAIQRYKEIDQGLEDAEINSRLVAYCSDQVYKWSIDILRKNSVKGETSVSLLTPDLLTKGINFTQQPKTKVKKPKNNQRRKTSVFTLLKPIVDYFRHYMVHRPSQKSTIAYFTTKHKSTIKL